MYKDNIKLFAKNEKDIKLFAKNEKELETLIHAVRIYCQDIGMEFGIEKWAMLVMKSGKRHLTDGMELQNQTRLGRSEKRKCTNTWTSWKLTSPNKWRWKKKIKNEYHRRTRKLLETKLCSRHLIKGINTWVVPFVRYLGLFLSEPEKKLTKWTKEQEN